MSVYKYIAELNPSIANDFCVSQGFPNASCSDELADNMVFIVAQNGELAFKKIMELHPDKEVLLEMFQCSSCQSKQQPKQQIFNSGITEVQPLMERPLQEGYLNANGLGIAKNTNTIILASAVLVALAIISTVK
jgi:hypothetical protein